MFMVQRESWGVSNSDKILSFMVSKFKMADPRTFSVKPRAHNSWRPQKQTR